MAHLLAPAILIEYGTPGETFAELTIGEGTEKNPKNRSAISALTTLRDPTFLFWATHLRLLYTRVYKDLFTAVQASHHHAAPMLAGSDGLPTHWAATMREGIAVYSAVLPSQPAAPQPGFTPSAHFLGPRPSQVYMMGDLGLGYYCDGNAVVRPPQVAPPQVVPPKQKAGKPRLSETACAPLVKLLKDYPSLGGVSGKHALDAIADLEAQAQHLESYFATWRSLEGLVHAVAREEVLQGPLPKAACELLENGKLGSASYFELLPRVPSLGALAAASEGLTLFEALSLEERCELPGTLVWLLFSPTTRDSAANPVFNDVKALAAAEVNPWTNLAYPYRCWTELTKVLVMGGAKYALSRHLACTLSNSFRHSPSPLSLPKSSPHPYSHCLQVLPIHVCAARVALQWFDAAARCFKEQYHTTTSGV